MENPFKELSEHYDAKRRYWRHRYVSPISLIAPNAVGAFFALLADASLMVAGVVFFLTGTVVCCAINKYSIAKSVRINALLTVITCLVFLLINTLALIVVSNGWNK